MTIRELIQELKLKCDDILDDEILSIGTFSGSDREYEYIIHTKEETRYVGKVKE